MQEDNAKKLTMEDCEYDAGIRGEKQGNTGMQEWEMEGFRGDVWTKAALGTAPSATRAKNWRSVDSGTYEAGVRGLCGFWDPPGLPVR